ncbi:ATP-binding protein [Yinghuangia seranimata]|uniref:ATP-binding protein n=1 Tax=Yinghuangia seranimata TaxID=408067 RepID=UPI00248B08BF|nr:ATP-binding protein [Yinghuangia seranimata]MDI2131692.1 ATP-binding protein [Yinghuangia seranimata]
MNGSGHVLSGSRRETTTGTSEAVPAGPLDTGLDALKLALTGYLTALDAQWRELGPGPGAVVAAAGVRRVVGAEEAARFAELTAWQAAARSDESSARIVERTEPQASWHDDHLVRIAAALGLDDGERVTVAAAWWAETEPQFAVALGCAHDDAARRYASAGLLRLLLAPYGLRLPAAWEDGDRLVRGGVLAPGAGCDGPLRLTPTARRILAGCPEADVCPTEAPPARHDEVRLRLAEFLSAPSAVSPGVSGPVPQAAPAAAGRGVVEPHASRPGLAQRLATTAPAAAPLGGPIAAHAVAEPDLTAASGAKAADAPDPARGTAPAAIAEADLVALPGAKAADAPDPARGTAVAAHSTPSFAAPAAVAEADSVALSGAKAADVPDPVRGTAVAVHSEPSFAAPAAVAGADLVALSGAKAADAPDTRPGGAAGAGLPRVLAVPALGAVLLRGPADAGIAALAYAAVRAAGRIPVADGRSRAELSLLARTGAGVPVVPAAALGELGWREGDGPLVAVGAPGDAAVGAFAVDIAAADPAQRAAHWRTRLREAGFSDRQARAQGRELAARLAFGEEGIDAVVEALRAQRRWSPGPPRAADVWPAVRRTARHALHRLAAPVVPAFTLDDLVLAEDVRAQLEEVVAHVRLAPLVFDDWGFRRRMPRGQGVAALFSGPPGTGKTMAAEAVAGALEQDLYRVDLSAVVSKYIGETEKNLAAAFDEAENAAAVLFFDECEGLFGKRTEQRDAHDRWANLEVDFLLQRVESFTGLVVLATNKRAALDEAFLRRLRFSVRFDVPGVAARVELWRRCLPDRVPREGLDAEALARRELAGGSIANAALAAAFLAAREGGVVGPAQVATALRREYDKLGKAWTEAP